MAVGKFVAFAFLLMRLSGYTSDTSASSYIFRAQLYFKAAGLILLVLLSAEAALTYGASPSNQQGSGGMLLNYLGIMSSHLSHPTVPDQSVLALATHIPRLEAAATTLTNITTEAPLRCTCVFNSSTCSQNFQTNCWGKYDSLDSTPCECQCEFKQCYAAQCTDPMCEVHDDANECECETTPPPGNAS